MARVVGSKYCLHQPLYRQSQVYGFAGVPLERSLLAQWRGEAFPELLQRLDVAIGKALQEGVVTNEINGGRFRLAPSSVRKKR